MKNFSQLIKGVNLNDYTEQVIDINKIKAQYNPDRFKFWKRLHIGPEKEVLNMVYSPHYRFLNNRKDKSYYQLLKLYGRNKQWIQNKISQFTNLFDSIHNEGYKDRIIILSKPLVKNKYNNSFEIFEGHHRVACCLICGLTNIPCKVVTI
jgi:hypothetical protein